jgi:hypothetical protein
MLLHEYTGSPNFINELFHMKTLNPHYADFAREKS